MGRRRHKRQSVVDWNSHVDRPPLDPPKRWTQREIPSWLIYTVLVLVAGPLVWGLVLMIEDYVANGHADSIDAWLMAKTFVERNLKSPSTASYGSVFGGDYQDPKRCVTYLGENRFEVKGWVDSQNGFGATLRADFILTIKDRRDGTWELIGEPIFVQR
jgi:hypothetical protein